MTFSEALFGWMYVNVLIIAGLICLCAVLVGLNQQPKVAPFAPPVEAPDEYLTWDTLKAMEAEADFDDMLYDLTEEGAVKLAEDKARLGRTYPLPRDKRRAA